MNLLRGLVAGYLRRRSLGGFHGPLLVDLPTGRRNVHVGLVLPPGQGRSNEVMHKARAKIFKILPWGLRMIRSCNIHSAG